MSWESGTASNFTDLLVKLNTFLLKGHSLPPVYTGTGRGALTSCLGTSTTVQEIITVTFSSATAFSVSGSVTGSMGSGTVGSLFTHSKLTFGVSQGTPNWASGDTITWIMTPPYVCNRMIGGCKFDYSSAIDMYQIVDGSSSTYARFLSSLLSQYISVKLLQAMEVRSIRLVIYDTPGYGPRDYRLSYSDNGTDWTVAQLWTAQTWTSSGEIRIHDVPSTGSHLFWKLEITAGNGTYVDLSEATLHRAIGGNTLDTIPWFGDVCWKAPGNGNADQIYTGVKLKWNPVGAYWCWRLGGFSGYTDGTQFENQPGAYTSAFMTLWDDSMPYWFIADGRCFKVIAKVTSQYEQAYMGFFDQYMAPGNYPYPLFIGGSMGFTGNDPAKDSTSYRYSVADETHRAFWSPGADNGSTNWKMAAFRRVSGNWQTVRGGFFRATYELDSNVQLWPYDGVRGSGWGADGQDLRANLDGTIPLFPTILYSTEPNVFGELSGVQFVSGNNQSVENIVTLDRIPYLVMQNIARVTTVDYVAFRLT